MERDRLRGAGVTQTDMTVGEWLDHWLRYVVDPNLRPDSARAYRAIVELCLAPKGERSSRSTGGKCCAPRLADIPLRRLTVADVQGWVSDHADRPHVLRYHRGVLRSALSEAERRVVKARVSKPIALESVLQNEIN